MLHLRFKQKFNEGLHSISQRKALLSIHHQHGNVNTEDSKNGLSAAPTAAEHSAFRTDVVLCLPQVPVDGLIDLMSCQADLPQTLGLSTLTDGQ
jgi:hypothetical protein